MRPPRVSVVMATYDRSNVLRYAIETVRWQTERDWELIVVGDACTDDTEAVVASFADPRIRYFNRDQNFGEQSAPNNDGVARARGQFLAFLNHDDLWLPNHLEVALAELNRGGFDLVYTPFISVAPDGSRSVLGVNAYTHRPFSGTVPASTWVMRSAVASSVGPWRAYTESYQVPSQDWLWRAMRAGHRIAAVDRITMVRISSTFRRDSYRDRHAAEHEACYRDMQRPGFLGEALTERVLELERWNRRVGWRHFHQGALNGARQLLWAMGFPPGAVANYLRYGRKGGGIDQARSNRGLHRLERE